MRDPLADPAPRKRPASGRRVLEASLVSDGTPAGTHVYLADGTELTQVRRIVWTMDASSGEASLTVSLGLGQIAATGRLDVQAGATPPNVVNRRNTP